MGRKNTVQFKFGLDTSSFEKGIKQSQKQVREFGKSVTDFAKSTAILTGPFIALGGVALKAAHETERAMSIIRAGTGATGKRLERLKATYTELWRSGPDDSSKVATALADLNTRLGATGASLKAMGKASLDASRLLGTDVAGTVKGFSSVMQTFAVSNEHGSKTLNDLFVTVQSSGVSFDDLTRSLSESAGALRSFGLDVTQSMDLVGQLSKAGLRGEQMKMGLNKARAFLANNDLGITSLSQLFERIKNDTKGFELATKVFGTEAAGQFHNALQNMNLDLTKLGEGLNKAQNELSNAATEGMTTTERLSGVMNRLKASLEPAGTAVLDLAERGLLPLAERFATIGPFGQKAIVAIGGFGAALAPLSWLIGQASNGVAGLIGFFGKLVRASTPLINVFRTGLVAGVSAYRDSVTSALAANTQLIGGVARVGTAARIGATSVGVLKGALAGITTLLSGPAGIISLISLAAVAIGKAFAGASRKAQAELERLNKIGADTRSMLAGFSTDRVRAEVSKSQATYERTKQELADLETRKAEYQKNPTQNYDPVYDPMGAISFTSRTPEQARFLADYEGKKAELSKRLAEEKARLEGGQKELSGREFESAVSTAKTAQELDALNDQYKGVVDDAAGRISARRRELEMAKETLTAPINAPMSSAEPKVSYQPKVSTPIERVSKAERIRDQVSYLGRDKKDALAEIDAEIAKIKTLTTEKKSLLDLQRAYRDELKQSAEQQALTQDRNLQWQAENGFISRQQLADTYAHQLQSQSDYSSGPTQWCEATQGLYDRFKSQLSATLSELKEQQDSNKLSATDYAAAIAELNDKYSAIPQAVTLINASLAQNNALTSEAEAQCKQLAEASKKWTEQLQNGIVDAIVQGGSLGDVLKDVGVQMEKMALKLMLFGSNGTGGLLGGLFGKLFGGLLPQANGGVWINGVQAYAHGGIVNAPTLFARAGGLGLMGEAGPEAILPLRRGSDGKLGVALTGGVASGGAVVNVTVNNQGSGSMNDAQARNMAEGLKATVDAAVAEALYQQQRRKVF